MKYNPLRQKFGVHCNTMYKISRSALVMHSTARMFELVNDVDHYSEFLPWCGASKVIDQADNIAVASVQIAFKGVKKTFTTRNEMIPCTCTNMTLVDGPFSELSGAWRFKEISQSACRISLELEFGFSNRLVQGVVGPVFRGIADSMVDAFCKRADQIYR